MEYNLFFFLLNKKQTSYLYDSLSIAQGIDLMRTHGYTCLPVINQEGFYRGSVDATDFLFAIQDHPEWDLEKETVGQLIRPGFTPSVNISASMAQLLDQSLQQNFVPVVDDRNVFIGIVTRKSIMSYLMEHKAPVQQPEAVLPLRLPS
jgi:CBS domain-containing protein